jgi:hypothetical protein
LLVATFSGVMSACFAYGLAAGDPIKAITLQHGTAILWQGLPVLIVVLAGGFTTNFIWCVVLNIRNRTGYQYFESEIREGVPRRNVDHILEPVTDAPGEEMAVAVALPQEKPRRAPMFSNYQFSAIAGTTWYMQFFFYTMGETQMGRYKFSSWTLHMASIIIFSTLWGIALHEWKGTGRRTKLLLAFSLLVLVTSTVVVGYGNYRGRPDALTLPIKQNSSKHAAFRELLEICHPPCKSFCAVLFHLFSGRRGFGKPVVEGIERLSSEKASSADRSFSGDHDCAATPNIPSAPLRCVCSNPYALDEFPVPTDCSRRFLENGNPSSLREKLSQLRAKVERSV